MLLCQVCHLKVNFRVSFDYFVKSITFALKEILVHPVSGPIPMIISVFYHTSILSESY